MARCSTPWRRQSRNSHTAIRSAPNEAELAIAAAVAAGSTTTTLTRHYTDTSDKPGWTETNTGAITRYGRLPRPGRRHHLRRSTRGRERLGHFAGGRWLPGRAPGADDEGLAVVGAVDEGGALAELFVGGEGLLLGAVECSTRCCTRPRTRSDTARDQGHLAAGPLPQHPLPGAGDRAGP